MIAVTQNIILGKFYHDNPNKRTRWNLKDQAHFYFDQLWAHGYCTRSEAYEHLAKYLSVPEEQAHMRVLPIDRCKEVIEFSVMMLNDFRRLDLDFGDTPNTPYYNII